MSELEKIAELCARLGATPDQATTMARQLLKRAEQLSAERKITREAAMAELLQLVVQGRQGIVPEKFQPPPSK